MLRFRIRVSVEKELVMSLVWFLLGLVTAVVTGFTLFYGLSTLGDADVKEAAGALAGSALFALLSIGFFLMSVAETIAEKLDRVFAKDS